MPNRMLRDWTDSLKFEAMPAETERLFVRLIMKADDYGRFHADPRLARAACYPLEDCTTAKVKDGLTDLAKRGLIYTYTVDDRPYLAIVNYGQRLKQSRPKFPQPDGESDEFKPTSGNFRELPARSRREAEEEGEAEYEPEEKRKNSSDRSSTRSKQPSYSQDFDDAWALYGRRGSKPQSFKYWRRLTDDQRSQIVATIPAYLECVKAGRPQKDFQGWINPDNELWAQDWAAILKEQRSMNTRGGTF